MFKKVLILDDLDFKRDRIMQYSKLIDSTLEFKTFCCARDFMSYLQECYKTDINILNDTILFLDWNFPFYKNEHIEMGAGETILFNINRRKYPIKVVIVSSDEVDYDKNEYPFVLGSIKDESFVYQKDEYEYFLKGGNNND